LGNRGPSHTSCIQGKRVIVRLRNGKEVRGKFEEQRSRFIVVAGTKIQREDVESFLMEKHAHANQTAVRI
jgi:hypothetical protein